MNLFSTIKILFFPELCICCGRKLLKSEYSLCIHCIIDAPFTKDWLTKENKLFIKICDRTLIENGCAIFEYHKGSQYSKMIHNIKFKHEKKAALDLGYLIGNKLYAEAEWIKDIDLILPVPLHKYRKYSRGYNQSEELSRGLNHSFNKEIDITSVIRHKRRKPQVKTSSYDERWENTKDLFHVVAPEKLEGKHILIVDDVVTTGATTISLIETIKAAAADVKISVLALSSTRKS